LLYGCGGKEIKRVARSEPREKEEGERKRKIDEAEREIDKMLRTE
jgi:hypothetical protein